MKKNVTKKIVYSAASLAFLSSTGTQILSPAEVLAQTNNGTETPVVEGAYNETEIGYCLDGKWIWKTENLMDDRTYTEGDCRKLTTAPPSPKRVEEYFGAVNVQSVGKYRTQEGAQPEADGTANLSWDVQWSPLYSIQDSSKEEQEEIYDITWIFVPKDISNLEITMFNYGDDQIPLSIEQKIPSSLDDFGELNEAIDVFTHALRMSAGQARESILNEVGLSAESDEVYDAIAIASKSRVNIPQTARVTGTIDVTDANSDVYVPLRATNKISTFKRGENGHTVTALSDFKWSEMGNLPEFSISDKTVNQKNAILYRDSLNAVAGLVGSPKCKPTMNVYDESNDANDGSVNPWYIIDDALAQYDDILIPESDRDNFRKFINVETESELQSGKDTVISTNVIAEDACDQSAHRILVDEKPEEEPTPSPSESPTPSPDPSPSEEPTPSPSEEPTPSPSESPTPSPSEEPTPSPSESPTPSFSEEPTPEPSGTPKTDTPTPPVIPTPEPKGTEDVPTTTEKTTEPGARIIEKKTEPKPVPPVVNHTFPEKQPVPQNPSRVNTPPFVPAHAPVQPAAIPGPVSEHGPVVNTGGAVQESFWTKIINIFR